MSRVTHSSMSISRRGVQPARATASSVTAVGQENTGGYDRLTLAVVKVRPCRIGYGPSAANSRPTCVMRNKAKWFKLLKFTQGRRTVRSVT